MAFLFGGERKTRADPVKAHQLEIRRAVRSMEREEARAAAADKALTNEIVACAREQKLGQCKAKAKQLVRSRAHRARLGGMRAQLSALGQQVEAVRGTQHMHSVMEQTTALMKTLNQRVNPRACHRQLVEFERQNAAFSMGQEVMQETLDAVFEADDEQEASDDALSGIFMELGLTEAAEFHRASTARPEAAPDPPHMHARLAGLRAQISR